MTAPDTEAPAALLRSQSLVRAEMEAVLSGRVLPFYDMARYALGWQEADGRPRADGGGKGMRPTLCLLGAAGLDASEAGRARALAGAAAVELVHSFSLVHDDIQDQDVERHHRPTVWKAWGVAQGINVGDALREMAQMALDRAQQAGAAAATVLAAQRLLNRAALEMIEGQYLDLRFEHEPDVGVEAYLDMIRRKTGAMMGCSLALGGILGGADAGLATRMDRAGRRLGLCFQIRDDYLGVWGDSARTGKSSDNDIRRRKKTYPVVTAVMAADTDTRHELRRLYAQPSLDDADAAAVRQILTDVDADGATQRAAEAEHAAFLEEMRGCALRPEAAAELEEIARFILDREH